MSSEPIPKIDRNIATLFLILSDNVCLRVKSMLEQLHAFQMIYGMKLKIFYQMRNSRTPYR
jgi:hypothetical protein